MCSTLGWGSFARISRSSGSWVYGSLLLDFSFSVSVLCSSAQVDPMWILLLPVGPRTPCCRWLSGRCVLTQSGLFSDKVLSADFLCVCYML